MSKKPFLDQRQLLSGPLKESYRRKFGVVPMVQSVPDIERWFDSPMGTSMLESEQAVLDRALGYMFGYHLLQLSVDRRANLFANSKVNHCFGLHPMSAQQGVYTGMSDFEHLPLAKRSIDVAVLHHVLDYSQHPHRVLREVARTIVPHGYIVIIGFNPASMMGAVRFLKRHLGRKPHQRNHGLRLSRVIDWLRVLDCEPVRIDHGYFRLPINSQMFIQSTGWMDMLGEKLLKPMGSFYMITARKEQASTIALKPQWQGVNMRAGFSVGKVAPRVPDGVAVNVSRRNKLH